MGGPGRMGVRLPERRKVDDGLDGILTSAVHRIACFEASPKGKEMPARLARGSAISAGRERL